MESLQMHTDWHEAGQNRAKADEPIWNAIPAASYAGTHTHTHVQGQLSSPCFLITAGEMEEEARRCAG